MDPLRQQILEYWLQRVEAVMPEPRDVANKYKTKKIMLRAHGVQTYYQIEFESAHQALSYEIVSLKDAQPLAAISDAPQLIGFLGAFAEAIGQIEVEDMTEAKETTMKEDMFFEQHFTQSLSETLGGLQGQRKNRVDYQI